MQYSRPELRLASRRLFHQISVHAAKKASENQKMPRSIRASIPLWLACSGSALTVLGVAFKLKLCIQLTTITPADGSVAWNPDGWNSVGWNTRSVWVHWGPLPQGLILLGLLMAFCGISMWAFRAALPKVMICGLALPVVASLTLIASAPLRCAAFGPLLTAILIGIILLVIGLGRFILRRREQ
jgi:hypothetical protein